MAELSAHEKELLKRWGFPILMLVIVAFVWWYFYKRGQVVATVVPNTSQSGVPTQNYYSGGGGGTAATNGSPAPSPAVAPIGPKPDVTPQPRIAYPQTDVNPADLSRLTYNYPPGGQPALVSSPGGGKCGCGGGSGGCCDSCGNGGATRFTDSQNTIIAASPSQQIGKVHNLTAVADPFAIAMEENLISANNAGSYIDQWGNTISFGSGWLPKGSSPLEKGPPGDHRAG